MCVEVLAAFNDRLLVNRHEINVIEKFMQLGIDSRSTKKILYAPAEQMEGGGSTFKIDVKNDNFVMWMNGRECCVSSVLHL